MLRRAALIALLAWGGIAAAQDTSSLVGRTVQFNAVTYDVPDQPILTSRDYIATAAEGPEFGMVREGTGGLDVVPVLIDIQRDRIVFDYRNTFPGKFYTSEFNGYVLKFLTECVLIAGGSIDKAGTTLPLTNKDLIITPQSLSINVSGLPFVPTDTIAVNVDVLDCPLS